MKDKFFNAIYSLYKRIYTVVLRNTYKYLTRKKSKLYGKISYKEKREIQKYWQKEYGKKIPLNEFRWYKGKLGKIDPRIIPDSVWHSEIEPFFNNILLEKGFQDKNYFDLIIGKENVPQALLRSINYQLLNCNYEFISLNDIQRFLNSNSEYIIKPSVDSGGGRGITFAKGKEIDYSFIEKCSKDYSGNFVIQKIIKQNPCFSKLNSSSTNTVRVLSFLFNNKVYILSSFLRVGAKGKKLDNISSGGVLIPIDKFGNIIKKAFSEDLISKDLKLIDFGKSKNEIFIDSIPYWNDINKIIVSSHYKLSHFKLINWDIAIENKKPIIIEYNLLDSSIYFHQIFMGPIFGDITTKVLNFIRDSRGKK